MKKICSYASIRKHRVRHTQTKKNAYPVKLRVTFERTVRYYLTRYDLTEEAYSKLNSSRLKGTDLTISEALKDLHRDAEKAAKELDPFSFLEFEKDFVLNHPSLNKLNRFRSPSQVLRFHLKLLPTRLSSRFLQMIVLHEEPFFLHFSLY